MIKAFVAGDELTGLADQAYEDLEPRALRAVQKGAEVLLRKVQELLSRTAPGGEYDSGSREYMRTVGGAAAYEFHRTHGGGPFRPPARRTGELYDSMQVIPQKAPDSPLGQMLAKRRGRSIRAGVGVWDGNPKERGRIARKAAALEYGGTDKKGRYHPPYPFMRPAEDAVEEAVRAAIDAELDQPEGSP